MSLNYELSPVQRLCPECRGLGRQDFDLCRYPGCDGVGRVFIEGGPSFGCRLTLAGCQRGQIVTLGNRDRGRLLRHIWRGADMDGPPRDTELLLIEPFFETEATEATWYPSCTGVLSASVTLKSQARRGNRGRADHLDPLQQRRPL